MLAMTGRKVRSLTTGETGIIARWEPLGSAMCDCLVQQDDGEQVWHASHTLRPTDDLGPLRSRGEAIDKAERKMRMSLDAIARKWRSD